MKENGSAHFLQQNKLTGKFEQLVKKTSKDALISKYRAMLAAEEKATAAEFDRAPPLGPAREAFFQKLLNADTAEHG
jgi:hypothetical protein